MRIFAGLRTDPFFLDVDAFRETVQTRRLAFKEVGDNAMAEKNVLSLVLEVDAVEVLGSATMFAVVAETLTVGEPPRPSGASGTPRDQERNAAGEGIRHRQPRSRDSRLVQR